MMTRWGLGGILACPLPPGYTVRAFKAGDDTAWVAIHELADAYDTFSIERFRSEFSQGEAALAERQLFVLDRGGAAVATSTAWFAESTMPQGLGRLHWLAVIPGHQNRGLGSALISMTLVRLRVLGYSGAYLTTSSVREGALRLYNRFGFAAGSLSNGEEFRSPETMDRNG
jgi:ribosomal protein S18 acetylase RimI-like enzyme